jgi:hypothetical protein
MAKSQGFRKQAKIATKSGSSITKQLPKTCSPLGPAFDPVDLERAHDALVWLLQDEEMPEESRSVSRRLTSSWSMILRAVRSRCKALDTATSA